MEGKDLTALLLEKMQAEQEQFKGWLLKQTPEEILRNTYQYTVKEDILFSFDALWLPDEQAQALLSSPAPLEYTRAKKLTPRMLGELVQRIEVHQAEKVNGVWEQRLTIHYNCVGAIDIPDILSLPHPEVTVNIRKGVFVNYVPNTLAG